MAFRRIVPASRKIVCQTVSRYITRSDAERIEISSPLRRKWATKKWHREELFCQTFGRYVTIGARRNVEIPSSTVAKANKKEATSRRIVLSILWSSRRARPPSPAAAKVSKKCHRELFQHRGESVCQAFDRYVTRIEAERVAISSYCRKSKQASKRGRDCFDVFWTMHQERSEAERIEI